MSSTAALCCSQPPASSLRTPPASSKGVASDPSGAVVVGARVTARNLDTGFSKETTAASDGFYRLLLLPVGRYSLTVEAPQFAVKVLEPIQVNVSQTVRVNVQLAVRALTEP